MWDNGVANKALQQQVTKRITSLGNKRSESSLDIGSHNPLKEVLSQGVTIPHSSPNTLGEVLIPYGV